MDLEFNVLVDEEIEVGEEEEVVSDDKIDLIELFITLVEKKPCLYDKKSPDYKISTRKENAWVYIADTLSMEVADCQKLWDKLRKRYSTDRRNAKVPTKSGSAASKKKPESTLLKIMSFMEAHIANRTTLSNVQKLQIPGALPSSPVQVPEAESSQSSSPHCSIASQSPRPSTSTSTSSSTSSSMKSLLEEGSGGDSFFRQRQKQVACLTDFLQKSSAKVNEFVEKRAAMSSSLPNEDKMFGDLLAAQAEKIKSGKRKREFQRKCLALLEDYLDDD